MLDDIRAALRQRGAVLLTGPAGIGKSFLASRAVEHVDAARAQCLAVFQTQSLRPLAYAIGAPLHGPVDDVATDVVAMLGDRWLVVEDLHWADGRTLAVVARLVGRVPLLVTSREPIDLGVPAPVTELRVPPLAATEARELAAAVHDELPEDERASLVAAAAGNPFLLVSLRSGAGVSPTLTEAVRERLSRAAPETIEVLVRLALHGRPAPRHWVARPMSLDAEGMVTEVGEGEVWFSHELFAREVLSVLDDDQITEQRRRLVEIVGESDAARHLYALGEGGRAADLAERAADGADPSARADLLALAVEARGADAPWKLRLAAADAMLMAHRTGEARGLVEQDHDDATIAAEARFRRAQAYWLDGDGERAVAEIDRGLEGVAGTGAEIEARSVVERALFLVRMRAGDPAIVDVADEAVEVARSFGVAEAKALNVSGLARSHTGSPGWRELFEEARTIAEADGDLDEILAANFWIVSSLGFYGPMTEAAELGDEMVEHTSRLGSRRWHHHFLAANVIHRFGLGRLDEARVESASLLLRNEPLFRNRAQLDLVRVCAECDAGRVERAAELLAEARRYVRNTEDAALVAIAAAELALRRSDPDAMLAAIDEIEATGGGFFGLNVLLESAAIHLSVCHPLDRIPSFDATLTPTLDVVALERTAHEHQVAGATSAAWTAMRRAAAAWEERSMLRFAYRARLSAARLALGADEVNGADAEIAVARRLGSVMERTPFEREVDELTRNISRVRTRSRLTPRTVEVLELVGDGLTSRDIAARLGISEATVDSHVADALHRLGCSTRRQAAALIA